MDPRHNEPGRLGPMREIARLFSVVEGERRYFQDLAANLPQAAAVFDVTGALVWANTAFRRLHASETVKLADVLPNVTLRVAAKRILEGQREPHTEQTESNGKSGPGPARVLRYHLAPNANWAADPEILILIEDLTDAVRQARAATEARYQPLAAITWELDSTRMEFTAIDQPAAARLGFEPELWNVGRSFWSRRFSTTELARVRTLYQTAPQGPFLCQYNTLDAAGNERTMRDHAVITEGRITGVTVDVTAETQEADMLRRDERISAQRALAGAVAHDNNNLLMILRGYGEDLLQALPEDSPLRANMREIVAATERLSAHTTTLAAYTAKHPAPVPEVIDFDAFLGQSALWAARFEPGGELVWQPGCADARIESDPKRLAEALGALLDSLQGPVRMASARVSHNRLRLDIVSIAGHAPPPGVFEVHSKADVPHGPQLHAAYQFLRSTGIAVVPQSHGYQLHFTALPTPAPATTAPPTVLVVDDEAAIRMLLRKVLQREGYNVLEADSAEAAITIAAGHSGDIPLLVSDVVMPGMGGVELAEHLSLRRAELRTLLISGHTGESALASAKLPHGFEFLQKPFSLPDLLNKVRGLLEQAKAG